MQFLNENLGNYFANPIFQKIVVSLLLLAARVISTFDRLTRPERVKVFILDDSVIKRNRSKKVELLARVYDQVEHKFQKGMAVGVVCAGFLTGNGEITSAVALALSLDIAIQNFPEGAIISMPLRARGMKKERAFLSGVLSGIVEPLGAVLTILTAQFVVPALSYLLSFTAGAMLYVVVEELIPEMSAGKHSNIGTVFFALVFRMMVLDVVLG